MIDLDSSGADPASGPATSVAAQQDGFTGCSGEQSASPAEIDHPVGGIDNDPPELTDQGGDDQITGIDWGPEAVSDSRNRSDGDGSVASPGSALAVPK